MTAAKRTLAPPAPSGEEGAPDSDWLVRSWDALVPDPVTRQADQSEWTAASPPPAETSAVPRAGTSVAALERIRESGSPGDGRHATELLGGFAGFGLLVAAFGLYGVLSYAVVRRTHEIGIRMALGATPRRILRDVLQRGGVLVGLGGGAGVAGAVALARLLQSVAGPIAVDDPLPFVAALAVLAGAALVACAAPARRAAGADPVASLRRE